MHKLKKKLKKHIPGVEMLDQIDHLGSTQLNFIKKNKNKSKLNV